MAKKSTNISNRPRGEASGPAKYLGIDTLDGLAKTKEDKRNLAKKYDRKETKQKAAKEVGRLTGGVAGERDSMSAINQLEVYPQKSKNKVMKERKKKMK